MPHSVATPLEDGVNTPVAVGRQFADQPLDLLYKLIFR
jgi:hypothetical protein